MKTFVLSMISIAATVAAMTACTSESDEINEVVEAKVPIELNAGVMEITTKAAINKGEAFDAKVIASLTSKTYSTLEWTAADAGNISVNAGGTVTFTPTQYYPADGKDIYMVGIAPRPTGTISNGTIDYTITGEQDIMFANEISGSKTKNGKADKELAFEHLLTQLKIKVIAENQEAINAWGTITSIDVVDAATVLTLNLNDGTIDEATAPEKKNLSLQGFTTAMPIPSSIATDAGYSMVLPKTTGNYQLLVKTSNNNTGATITPTNLTKLDASTAYEITLTFKATNVDVTASAGEWITDKTGAGTVQ